MHHKAGWKEKILRELTEYWINFIYLALFFGVFLTYRRLLMAEYHIGYTDYGISIIKALILAKVIMIGDILRLGRQLEDKPLIFPTLYKTIVFTVWVICFSILESTISGLLHGQGLAGGVDELLSHGWYEVLARGLIVFCAFLPFFAFRELGRILEKGQIRQLFFRRKTAGQT
jgi:hypothetical protein